MQDCLFVDTPFVAVQKHVSDALFTNVKASVGVNLLAAAFLLQVRLHIHLPCQLLSFGVSAAVLPKAICRAGFSDHAPWKCIAVGVSAQFLIGVVLSTGIVALNEKRLRKMYIRSIAVPSAAARKAKEA